MRERWYEAVLEEEEEVYMSMYTQHMMTEHILLELSPGVLLSVLVTVVTSSIQNITWKGDLRDSKIPGGETSDHSL